MEGSIFSNDKDNEVMQTNIKNGGYGVYKDEGNIIVQKNSNFEKLIEIKSIGITMEGVLKYNIENAMAACGAAVGLGVNNIMVVLDYGHNVEGYKCVLDG